MLWIVILDIVSKRGLKYGFVFVLDIDIESIVYTQITYSVEINSVKLKAVIGFWMIVDFLML